MLMKKPKMKRKLNLIEHAKQISMIAVCSLCVISGGIIAEANSEPVTRGIRIFVDSAQLYTDVEPVVKDNRTFVPVRAIFEHFGMYVEWNDSTKVIKATKEDSEIQMRIDDNRLYMNGEWSEMDVAPLIFNNRTMVPVRAVSEALGCEVVWEDATNTININKNGNGNSVAKIDDSNGIKTFTMPDASGQPDAPITHTIPETPTVPTIPQPTPTVPETPVIPEPQTPSIPTVPAPTIPTPNIPTPPQGSQITEKDTLYLDFVLTVLREQENISISANTNDAASIFAAIGKLEEKALWAVDNCPVPDNKDLKESYTAFIGFQKNLANSCKNIRLAVEHDNPAYAERALNDLEKAQNDLFKMQKPLENFFGSTLI